MLCCEHPDERLRVHRVTCDNGPDDNTTTKAANARIALHASLALDHNDIADRKKRVEQLALVMDLRENTARMHFLPTATPLPPSARPPTPEAAPAERPPAERPRPARVSVTPEPRRTWPALVAAGRRAA